MERIDKFKNSTENTIITIHKQYPLLFKTFNLNYLFLLLFLIFVNKNTSMSINIELTVKFELFLKILIKNVQNKSIIFYDKKINIIHTSMRKKLRIDIFKQIFVYDSFRTFLKQSCKLYDSIMARKVIFYYSK